jgi:hypothetical protein
MWLSLAVATVPTAGAVTSMEVHWDVTTLVVALITGVFGTIQVYMLRSLHTMVNSQQSALNEIARRDAINASYEAGLNVGGMHAREKAEGDAKDLLRETKTKEPVGGGTHLLVQAKTEKKE